MKPASLLVGSCQGIVVVIGVCFALSHSEAYTPLSLVRELDVTAGANVNSHAPSPQQHFFSSSASGLFDETRQAKVVASGMGDNATGTATAFQRSLVQFSLVEAEAETNVALSVNTASGGGAFGDAVTDMIFEFSLNVSTDYHVTADVDRFGQVSDASVELLLNSSTTIFAIGEPTGYLETSIMQSGTLFPGSYRLIAAADTMLSFLDASSPSTSGAEFSLLFTLDVIPGDFDHDGDVDGRDFLVWQRNPSVRNLADWKMNYGTPLNAAVTALPEPITSLLVCSAIASQFLCRRNGCIC